MKNLILNEQQVEFIKEILSYNRDQDWFDSTSKTIAGQILSKLEE